MILLLEMTHRDNNMHLLRNLPSKMKAKRSRNTMRRKRKHQRSQSLRSLIQINIKEQ
jgi:hypothetical protein